MGAVVSESAMLNERSSLTQREVDILIEHKLAGHRLRIGIECRDRAAKDDITWVDGIIGKYRDLDVDKVILVSRSGFTQAATEKALANRIECCTLQEFSESDVSHNLRRLRMSYIERFDAVSRIDVITNPVQDFAPLEPATTVYNPNGIILGTLDGITWHIFVQYAQQELTKQIDKTLDSLLPPDMEFIRDVDLTLPVHVPQPFPYYLRPNAIQITALVFYIRSRFVATEKHVENYWFQGDQVVLAHIDEVRRALFIRKSAEGDDTGTIPGIE